MDTKGLRTARDKTIYANRCGTQAGQTLFLGQTVWAKQNQSQEMAGDVRDLCGCGYGSFCVPRLSYRYLAISLHTEADALV